MWRRTIDTLGRFAARVWGQPQPDPVDVRRLFRSRKEPSSYLDYLALSWRCSVCPWEGLGRECIDARWPDDDYAESLTCPRCGGSLEHFRTAFFHELSRNRERLSAKDRVWLEMYEQWETEEPLRLDRDPPELPELEGDRLVFTWDVVGREDVEIPEVKQLRMGDQVLWQERCYWENWERFLEMAAVLRQRYGDRLYDLVPTQASLDSLYGDRLSAPNSVDAARAELRVAWDEAHAGAAR
ncbi:MAG: hypothetical protein ACO1SX_19290 [Actinomycetota bacterium]